MEVLAEGLAGSVGGLFGRCVAFPFDTLRIRWSTAEAGTELGAVVRRVLKEEGISGFYRGLPFSALDVTCQKFLYVFFYAALKRLYSKLAKKDPATIATLLCGYVADILSSPFTMPIEATVVQLQRAPPDASKIAIVRKGLSPAAFASFFTSFANSGSIHFVLGWKPAFEFAFFDTIKGIILKAKAARNEKVELMASTAFFLGAIARASAASIVYPFNHGKALMQAEVAATWYAGIATVLRTEGLLALYRGLSLELARGVTQSALMFMMKEQVSSTINRIVLGK